MKMLALLSMLMDEIKEKGLCAAIEYLNRLASVILKCA